MSRIERDAVRAEIGRAMRARHPAFADEYLGYLERALAEERLDFPRDVERVLSVAVAEAFPDRADELVAWTWLLLGHPTFDREVPGVDPRALRFFVSFFNHWNRPRMDRVMDSWNAKVVAAAVAPEWTHFVALLDPGLRAEVIDGETYLDYPGRSVFLGADEEDLAQCYPYILALSVADRALLIEWVRERWR